MSSGILIVDDSPQIRNMIRLWLESETRFRICGEAGDGVEGIEKALNLKPDLIVLDLSMPRMGGMETAAALRAAMPGVPIILFTLYADPEVTDQAHNVGIASVLSKMDQMSMLCSEVGRLVGAA
jgi:DNA-binding NarL/FixJ family response regulator